MKAWKNLVVLFALLFSVAAVAADQPKNEEKKEGVWMAVEIGSPFHNSIMEADAAGVRAQFGDQAFIAGIRDAELKLGLRVGEYYQVNLDTGEVRKLEDADLGILKELKRLGVFLLDVAKDSVVVLPMDLFKDLKLVGTPSETSEDQLSWRGLLCKQAHNVADDLRSASGLNSLKPFEVGNSGTVKIVISVLNLDPVGTLEGGWDVVVGVAGAGEDVVFTPLKLVRKGVRWVVEKVSGVLPW